tara:strand:- start:7512 stop:8537 length:1026 start_codon:yes stop_codon:yes gene_type:complete
MKLLDLFSGIGGFHLGLEQSGFKFDWVGFSEIDKYASKQYKRRFPNATELGNITTVQPKNLPSDITILCGGFPCQAFSIAGKRQGFNDTRGTLFFEIARILRYFKDIGKPIPYFVLENVKGLLNHDNGQTFATIYGVLSDLDYTVECQLLNTKWWLPQNRERIYIVGHLGERGRSKIFPITKGNKKTLIKKVNFKIADYRNDEGLRIRKDGNSPCLSQAMGTGGQNVPLLINKKYNFSQKSLNKTLEKFNLNYDDTKALDLYNKKAQDICPTLTEPHHNCLRLYNKSTVRKLTPIECERLQGFPDDWTEGQSDTQRYKQLGNAVSVPVVKAVGDKIIKLIN